jgi:hypothetical protein
MSRRSAAPDNSAKQGRCVVIEFEKGVSEGDATPRPLRLPKYTILVAGVTTASVLAAAGGTYALFLDGGLFWVLFEAILLGTIGGVVAVVVTDREGLPRRVRAGALLGMLVGVVAMVSYTLLWAATHKGEKVLLSPALAVAIAAVWGAVQGAVAGAVGVIVSAVVRARGGRK